MSSATYLTNRAIKLRKKAKRLKKKAKKLQAKSEAYINLAHEADRRSWLQEQGRR